MRRGFAWLPSCAVVISVVLSMVAYPLISPPKPLLRWPAIQSYYSNNFAKHGFSIQCSYAPSLGCRVVWKSDASSSSSEIEVYRCLIESQERARLIVSRFASQAAAHLPSEELEEVAGTLQAFFASGLRKTCDEAVLSAEGRIGPTKKLGPFLLSQEKSSDLWVVSGIEKSYGTIAAGLPKKPSFSGDIVGYAQRSSFGASADFIAAQFDTANGLTSVGLLSTAGGRACRLWPGSATAHPCQAASVHMCDPQADFYCREPVLELRAIDSSRMLIRVGSQRTGSVYLNGRERLALDELVLIDILKDSEIHVLGHHRYPGFSLSFKANSSIPISRLQVVNSRWERWFDSTMEPWIKPLVADYERLAELKLVKPDERVTLGLDVSLQKELELALADWMQDNAEARVIDHLEKHHFTSDERILAPVEKTGHRRPVPQAGITVLDAATGAIWAVASYPPAGALDVVDGIATFGNGWKERLAGERAPDWAIRHVLGTLESRLREEGNANFSTHPIGSSFKPILLSLFIDRSLPARDADGLHPLFDLVVKGHLQSQEGGEPQTLQCTAGEECKHLGVQAIVGLPAGPWGREEGQVHGGEWVDRWEYINHSCNKYSVSLGLLSLLNWRQAGNPDACCWSSERDTFAFVQNQVAYGLTPRPGLANSISSPSALPPLGPWLDLLAGRISANVRLAEAPVFSRLWEYYGISPRSSISPYDSGPWRTCLQGRGEIGRQVIGRIATTELKLTDYPVSTSFTNIFTGSGRNWWTNVKLAEAYMRLATNRRRGAVFCGNSTAQGGIFQDVSRHAEMVRIMSTQRHASWVHTPEIDRWQAGAAADRATLSKTGTSIRGDEYESTGVFAIFIGEVSDRDVAQNLPTRVGNGVVVVAHVDDVGGSEVVTRLVDHIFGMLQGRIDPW